MTMPWALLLLLACATPEGGVRCAVIEIEVKQCASPNVPLAREQWLVAHPEWRVFGQHCEMGLAA
jgi:hypothetical protein